MSRETFMKELEYLLQDIGEEERSDALAYYRDYLDEAGPENEEKVLQEFGSPERVAAMIRASLNGNMEEGGEFTETGYGDERFKDPGYEVQKKPAEEGQRKAENEAGSRADGENFQASGRAEASHGEGKREDPGTSRTLKIVLWAILIIVAAPVIFSVGGGVLSMIAGIAFAILVIFFCIALAAVAAIIGGIAAVVGGGVYLFVDVLTGALFIGIGLIALGIGLLLLVLSVWFYGKLVPMLFRSILDGCNRLVHRGRRQA
ncbi:MAG TPA: hypothetical protein IAA04_05525 [Candidatus Lachnoclostridium pullistercoris]|uniref:DUF1700 domain-containing protein n=1 Tax=Candidatus Lachnoclostridium pullistercoris TaxID=2838632 RepID=A0A9D2PC54_9FIRM|nr:hypothetical protein [Candidatus Lachnoclostridium pullistercoris]